MRKTNDGANKQSTLEFIPHIVVSKRKLNKIKNKNFKLKLPYAGKPIFCIRQQIYWKNEILRHKTINYISAAGHWAKKKRNLNNV